MLKFVSLLVYVTLLASPVRAQRVERTLWCMVQNGRITLVDSPQQQIAVYHQEEQAAEDNPPNSRLYEGRVLMIRGTMSGNAVYGAKVLGMLEKPLDRQL